MTELRQQEGALRARRPTSRPTRAAASTPASASWRGRSRACAPAGRASVAAFQRVHLAWQEKQARVTRALDDLESALRETDRDTTANDRSEAAHLTRYAHRL